MSSSFYRSTKWAKTRQQVLKLDHYECVYCKERHRHSRAEIVHHKWHLDEYPQYALDIWVGDERNLVSVCRWCHENVCHPERLKKTKPEPPLTQERW